MASSSWIEQVVSNPITVKAQYDTQVSNQCSWCAHQLVAESRKLLKADTEEFQALYAEAIDTASQQRIEHYKYSCGENIDDPYILNIHQHSHTIVQWLTTEIGAKDDIYPFLDKEFRQVFYDRDYDEVSTDTLLKHINELQYVRRFMVVSRFGQSFALVGTGKPDQIMILDSHFHTSGTTTANQAYDYILQQQEGGYNKILWGWGYVK